MKFSGSSLVFLAGISALAFARSGNKYVGEIACLSNRDPTEHLKVKAGQAVSEVCEDLRVNTIPVPKAEGEAEAKLTFYFTTDMPVPGLEKTPQALRVPAVDEDGVIALSGLTVPADAPQGKMYLLAVLGTTEGVLESSSFALEVIPEAEEEAVELILEAKDTDEVTTSALLLPGSKNPVRAAGKEVRVAAKGTLAARSLNSMPKIVAGVMRAPSKEVSRS